MQNDMMLEHGKDSRAYMFLRRGRKTLRKIGNESICEGHQERLHYLEVAGLQSQYSSIHDEFSYRRLVEIAVTCVLYSFITRKR